jgi:hypothetical protein
MYLGALHAFSIKFTLLIKTKIGILFFITISEWAYQIHNEVIFCNYCRLLRAPGGGGGGVGKTHDCE